MKLPAFQFYPADWRKDPGVQSLTFHDRGVWFEILCLMHESEQRGKLLLNGKAMPDEVLARLLHLDKQILTRTLATLIEFGVATRDEQGVFTNRRMVRDEHIRQVRAEAGKKGGNPVLVNQNAKQNPSKQASKNQPLHSSSSTSSSTSEEKREETPQAASPKGTRLPHPFFLTKEMREYGQTRRPAIDLEEETEKFVNYWRAKTGRDATKLDWIATWQNWILNARGKNESNQRNNINGKPTSLDRIESTQRVIEQYPTEAELRGQS